MSYQYKNKSGQNLIIPGVGTVDADGTIESSTVIDNPNLELVSSENNQPVVGTEAPQPNAVVEATKTASVNGMEVK